MLRAIMPAFGGSLSRFGVPSALYVTEFLGAVPMFLGFLRATRPMKDRVASKVDTRVS